MVGEGQDPPSLYKSLSLSTDSEPGFLAWERPPRGASPTFHRWVLSGAFCPCSRSCYQRETDGCSFVRAPFPALDEGCPLTGKGCLPVTPN